MEYKPEEKYNVVLQKYISKCSNSIIIFFVLDEADTPFLKAMNDLKVSNEDFHTMYTTILHTINIIISFLIPPSRVLLVLCSLPQLYYNLNVHTQDLKVFEMTNRPFS
jgi:hypothetical protein